MTKNMNEKMKMEEKSIERALQLFLAEVEDYQKKLDIDKIDSETKNEVKLSFEKLFSDMQRMYEIVLQKEYLESAYLLNRKMKKYVKNVSELADKQEDSYLYTMGTFVGAYHVLSGKIPERNEDQIFNVRMSQTVGKAHVKATISHLYNHENVQHGDLCDKVGIAPSQLNRVMKDLVEIDCVKRYSVGKYSYYSLSDKGKKYVKEIVLPGSRNDIIEHTFYKKLIDDFGNNNKRHGEVSFNSYWINTQYEQEVKREEVRGNHVSSDENKSYISYMENNKKKKNEIMKKDKEKLVMGRR